MVIDIHTHVFPDRIAERTIRFLSEEVHIHPFTDGTVSGLRRSMDEAEISVSVVQPVATSVAQVEKLNDKAAILTERRDETGVLSFGCMHPEYSGYKAELARIAELGLPGVKVHPPYQGAALDDIRYLRIFGRAAELGLPVLTHAGLDIGIPEAVLCTPAMARHVVDEIGDFPFILAHMGGWRNWDEVPRLLADTGVFLDTAFAAGSFTPLPDGYWDGRDTGMLDAEQFLGLIRCFGADRILFGTDSPWGSQKETLAFLRDLPLTEEEKKKILGENAQKLLKL